jgi:hypothetical protein
VNGFDRFAAGKPGFPVFVLPCGRYSLGTPDFRARSDVTSTRIARCESL